MRRKVRLEDARRLAVARQALSGPRPKSVAADDIHALVRAIGCLQLDPTLLWDERRLYEYWAHQASIVPTEDRTLHAALPPPWLDQRTTAAWMTTRARFAKTVLERLAANGSVRAADFEQHAEKYESGWVSAARSATRWRSSGSRDGSFPPAVLEVGDVGLWRMRGLERRLLQFQRDPLLCARLRSAPCARWGSQRSST
jgi:uncharacterized protein YcaQ